jgi:hypothetical protein
MGGGKSSMINSRTSGSGAGVVVVVVKLVVVAIVVGVQVGGEGGATIELGVMVAEHPMMSLRETGRWTQRGMPRVSAPVPDPAAP